MSENSSVIEKTERKPFLVRMKEVISKRKKEERFRGFLKQTTAKLLNDIRVGGYVAEEYDEKGKHWRTFYSVALKGVGNRRYSVLIISESDSLLTRLYPNPEDKAVNFNLFAEDIEYINATRRTFTLGASRLEPGEPFFTGDGASLLDIYKVLDQHEHPRKKMPRKEQEAFLEELRTTTVDIERTKVAFESAKMGSPNWNIYWFRDKPTDMLPLR